MHCVPANDVIGLFTCCADLSTGDQLIAQRTYPNASESELFTGDTSE